MSDVFTIDFGNVKEQPEFIFPEEGNYTLVVDAFDPKPVNDEDRQHLGFNIALTFHIDAEGISEKLKVFHNLYVNYENPFAALAFFSALTGASLENVKIDVSKPAEFIGMKVGAILTHDTYKKASDTENDPLRKKFIVAKFDHFYAV